MIARLIQYKSDNTLIQLFRYTFVGGIAFIADFGLLYMLTEYINIYYLISAVIAFSFGLVINYLLSIIWVFTNRSIKSKWIEFSIFTIIGIFGLLFNVLFICFFTEIIHFHYLFSKIISTLFVYLWNFFARKYLLFHTV